MAELPELKNIKDMTPNDRLVTRLRELLEQAEKGEIRSMVYAVTWDDNDSSHGWCRDPRTSYRSMLTELVMTGHDFMVNVELAEQESVLYQKLTGDQVDEPS